MPRPARAHAVPGLGGAAAVRAAVGRGAGPDLRRHTPSSRRCSRPTSPRPRSRSRACGSSWTAGSRASAATARAPSSSDCRSSPCRRRAPTSARAAAGAWARASASGSTPRTSSRRDRATPIPEILRTNLASLILQMAALAARRSGGLSVPRRARHAPAERRLSPAAGTERGRRRSAHHAARPADGRACRSIRGWHACCSRPGAPAAWREALVIAAFLSIQDPRERPADKTEAADEKHAQFADERSDFIARAEPLAGRARAGARAATARCAAGAARISCRSCACGNGRTCTSSSTDIAAALELTANARAGGRRSSPPGDPDGIPRRHRRARRRPHLPRRTRCALRHRARARRCRSARRAGSWPRAWSRRSACTRGWSRRCSRRGSSRRVRISSGAPTARRNGYAERGMVVARETVSLYGRVLSSGRQVNFATVDPATARRMFVEEALVRRQSIAARRVPRAQRSVRGTRSSGSRRSCVGATCWPREDVLAAFYLERIPADVASTRASSTGGVPRNAAAARARRAAEVLLAQPLPQVAHGSVPGHVDARRQRPAAFLPVRPDEHPTTA